MLSASTVNKPFFCFAKVFKVSTTLPRCVFLQNNDPFIRLVAAFFTCIIVILEALAQDLVVESSVDWLHLSLHSIYIRVIHHHGILVPIVFPCLLLEAVVVAV